MKILMFGWEFPPQLSKELGTRSHVPPIKVDFSVTAEVKHRMHRYNNLSATLKKNTQKDTTTFNLVKATNKIKNLYESIYTKYLAEA
jgi:hypothetical protein